MEILHHLSMMSVDGLVHRTFVEEAITWHTDKSER